MAAKSGGHGDTGSGPGPGAIPRTNINTNNSEAAAEAATNYAAMAKKEGDKWLALRLYRENSSISYNLSKKERATLLFRRLKIPPGNVRSFEACNFEMIRIEFQGDIDIERFKTSTAIQIRPGLKVQPMKEIKRTTRIKVC